MHATSSNFGQNRTGSGWFPPTRIPLPEILTYNWLKNNKIHPEKMLPPPAASFFYPLVMDHAFQLDPAGFYL
jgi:hypothetical protein